MTIQRPYPFAKRQDEEYTQPTQELPYWLSASATTIPNPSIGGTAIVTVAIVNLPLTYYGPSIPLGPGWVYGGSAAEGSIYAPVSDESSATATSFPTLTETSEAITTFESTASPSSSISSIPTETSPTVSIESSSGFTSTTSLSTASLTTASSTEIPSSTGVSSSDLLSSSLPEATSSAVPAPAALPPAGHLPLSSGAIVGIVIGGIISVVLCCLLAWCCCCRRRGPRRSYISNSDPRDPEVVAGVAEGSSLLSARLPGGESPPLQSPTLSTHTLRGVRPRTPLSTRRFPYNPVPAGVVAGEVSGSMEPSRVSSEEVHRRSTGDRLDITAIGLQPREIAGGDAGITTLSSTPRSGQGRYSSSGSGSTSPRQRLSNIVSNRKAAAAGGLFSFLNLRSRRHEDLGEGWEEVGAPPRSTMGLGMHIPEEARYTMSSPEPFPPQSIGNSSNPSRVNAGIIDIGTASTKAPSADRPRSFISGQTQYHDASSRPHTPASGLVAGGVIGAAAANEMRQREFGLVSRQSDPPVPPLPLLPPAPVATRAMAPTVRVSNVTSTSGDPFQNPAYAITTSKAFDDALDSPPPQGLFPPGLEQNARSRWTRSTIEHDDGVTGTGAVGGLDDEPPQAAGAFAGRVTGDNFGAAASARAAGLSTPSIMTSRVGSPFSMLEERDIAGAGTDDEETGRPWSGQVRNARYVSVDSTRPVWTQSAGTVSAGEPSTTEEPTRHTVIGTMTPPTSASIPAPATPPRAVSGRDWTIDLDSPLADVPEEEDPYDGIMEYFRHHPETERATSVVVPTGAGGFQVTSAAGAPLHGIEEGSEASSLLAGSDGGGPAPWRSLLRPEETRPPRPASS